jgi:UDP-N-acetylmuramate--alanine ligase
MIARQHVHLVGIGGAGLSAIATVLLEQGYTVSGSDLRASPVTERLARLGAAIHVGHDAANLGSADMVVISSAVPAGNPEVDEARRRGIPVIKRAEWLGGMMAGRRGIAIAGTHGKTTTTAMIALILRDAGLAPTFIVGGDIPQLGTSAAAGLGDVFVIEADEYDHTFLGLRPEIAVVTVVEWDHPDCYPTPEAMVEAFRQFVQLVPPQGLVVACGDDPGVASVLATGGPDRVPLRRYGLNEDNDWRAVEAQLNAHGGYDFEVQVRRTSVGTVSLAVPGMHNVKNSLAALAVADWLDVPFDRAAATLAGFSGVGRRFEVKGEARGVLVIDDYAHHPTEIRATLAAARTRYPDRPMWVVFQPHTYSRTRALLDDFAAAFGDADHVIIVDIFPAREMDDGSVSSRDIMARMRHPDARVIGPLEETVSYLVGHLRPGDVLMTLGAGDGYRVGERVLEIGS